MAQLRRRRSKLSKVELARASGQIGAADPLPAASTESLPLSASRTEGPAPAGTVSVAKPDDLEVLERAALSLWSEGRRNEALTILESRIALEKDVDGGPSELATLRAVPIVAAAPSLPAIVSTDRPRAGGRAGGRRTWATGLAAGLALVFVPGAVLWADGRLPHIDVADDAQQAPASLAKPLHEVSLPQSRTDTGAVRQAGMLPAAQPATPAKDAGAASHIDVMALLKATWQNVRSSELADHWSAPGHDADPAQVLERAKSALQPLQDAGRSARLALAANADLSDVYALSLGIGSPGQPADGAARGIAVALQEPAAAEAAADADQPIATPRPPKPRPATPQAAKPKVRATQQAQATDTRLSRNRAAAQRYAAAQRAQPPEPAGDGPVYADAGPYVPPPPVYYYYAPRPAYGPAVWPRTRGFVWFRRSDGW